MKAKPDQMRRVPEVFHPGRHNPLVIDCKYPPAMSFEEIAAAMGCNKQTVWMIYARALEKIRRELRKHPRRYAALMNHEELGRAAVYPDWRVP